MIIITDMLNALYIHHSSCQGNSVVTARENIFTHFLLGVIMNDVLEGVILRDSFYGIAVINFFFSSPSSLGVAAAALSGKNR